MVEDTHGIRGPLPPVQGTYRVREAGKRRDDERRRGSKGKEDGKRRKREGEGRLDTRV